MSGSDTELEQNEEQLDWAEALSQTSQNLSNDTEDSPEPLQVEGSESTETDSETEQDSTSREDPEPLEPLEQWSDDQKAIFTKLDRDAQKFLIDRNSEMDAGFTKKTQELAEQRKRFESLDQVLKPYEEVLQRQGQQVAPVVAQALSLLSQVSQDPAAAVRQAIQSYGLTPEQLGLADDDDLTDPTIKALRQQVSDLEQRLNTTSQKIEVGTQQESQAQIDAFRSATNEDGSLKHPHFEDLRTLMAPLVNDGKTLEEAYSQVVYTIPEYRDSQIKAEAERAKKEAEEKAEAARAAKAKKAKEATTLPNSDVDSGGEDLSPHKSWQDSLQETLNQLSQ